MAQPSSNGVNLSSLAPVPELAGRRLLLGHFMEFKKDPVVMMDRGWREHGDLARFRLGPKDCVLFTGPDAHDAYFKASEDQLDPRDVYQFTVPIFGRGVAYDVAPEIMSEQLAFLFPALREPAMRRFARIMYQEVKLFADSLDDEGEINLPVELNRLTVKIASHCLIGKEIRETIDEGFADAYHYLQNGINLIGFFAPNLPIPAHRARDKARKKIVKLLIEIMDHRRSAGAEPDDFMNTLMQASYKDGRKLTNDEITGILLTVLFAGQHTSTVLATWTGLEVANSPETVDWVRDEMKEVYNTPDAILNYDTLKRQVAMECVIRENERLHPPLILLIRKVLKPMQYKDQVVDEGALAMVSPAVSHRLPELFKDPEKFHPQRFDEPRKEHKQHHYSLIGFGGGKHQCMGKHFAYMQLKAIWTVLLDSFDFFNINGVPAPNYGSWVTGPKEPCMIRYRRRTKSRLLNE
ncbi:MAG: cytochrome P450 [Bacteroidetes bacterium]|nr:cytochrome P450 [Bacteroidota bacterium]